VKNPYEVIGVERTATADELRTSYRRLAKKLHPDLNPGDAQAEARFKEVSAAYDLLSDPEKRKRFDSGEIDATGAERPQRQYYKDFAAGGGPDGAYADHSGFADLEGAGEIFAELFRRQARTARGADLRHHLTVDFLDAVNGSTSRLTSFDGSAMDVAIPAGIEEGQTLRLRGKGAPAPGEGEPGDALIEISVRPHRFFVRDGADIRLDLPITLKEAVLGAKVKIPTPTGNVMVTVPKGSTTGAVLRLRGRGGARRGGHGDEFITLKVMTPPQPDAVLDAFLEGWTPSTEYDPRKDMLG
jgi:DnaJ-class molecular chaperone